ncbi:MAG: 4-hydroxythreonine-4-phosphate dehydrogenase PdxA, partial [Nevskiaceae bacterium]
MAARPGRNARRGRPPRRAAAVSVPRLFVTPGEPAGIGPDLVLAAARRRHEAELVAVADPILLEQRARRLRLRVALHPFDP